MSPESVHVLLKCLTCFTLCLSLVQQVTSVKSCQQVRNEALIDSLNNEIIIVPECDKSNANKFATIQCHNLTGYCWCVDSVDGKPIPNTSVRINVTPDCTGRSRVTGAHGDQVATLHSHSNANHSHLRSRIIRKEPISSMSCEQNIFASNLLLLIKNEYRSTHKISSSASFADIDDRRILNWKFHKLDGNLDGHLKRRELSSFRKLIKNSIEPRSCFKSWFKVLDADQDNLVVKAEWIDYFTPKHNRLSFSTPLPPRIHASGMNPLDFLAAVHSRVTSSASLIASSSPPPAANPLSNFHHQSHPVSPSHSYSSDPLSILSESRSKSSSESDIEDDEDDDDQVTLSSGKDCKSAREQAELLRVKNVQSKTYIPACTANGKYEEVQCFRGFCWCVDIDKGLPLKGSGTTQLANAGDSSANVTLPNCKHGKPVSRGKECPYEQKLTFLKLLTALFTHEMLTKEKNSRHRLNVLHWKYLQMDKNSDKVVDTAEWKVFKKSIRGTNRDVKSKSSSPSADSSFNSVRHCFKLFFRGCDLNKDSIITLTEWFECTGKNLPLDTLTNQRSSPNSTSTSSRRGSNHFANILKAD